MNIRHSDKFEFVQVFFASLTIVRLIYEVELLGKSAFHFLNIRILCGTHRYRGLFVTEYSTSDYYSNGIDRGVNCSNGKRQLGILITADPNLKYPAETETWMHPTNDFQQDFNAPYVTFKPVL